MVKISRITHKKRTQVEEGKEEIKKEEPPPIECLLPLYLFCLLSFLVRLSLSGMAGKQEKGSSHSDNRAQHGFVEDFWSWTGAAVTYIKAQQLP